MQKFDCEAKIIDNRFVSKEVCRLALKAPFIVQAAQPGQFVQVLIEGKDLLLRRPLGIARVDVESGTMEVFFRIVGKGTRHLVNCRTSLRVLGPLGNGFTVDEKKTLIVGGGMGLAPLLFLAERLPNVDALLGGRNSDELFWEEYFFKLGTYEAAMGCRLDYWFGDCLSGNTKSRVKKVYMATDDGSRGVKGFAVDLLPQILATGQYERLAVCGPDIMMKKAAAIAKEYGVACEVSLERRMACGLGACLSCNIDATDGRRLHVCQDGPVFKAEEVFASEE